MVGTTMVIFAQDFILPPTLTFSSKNDQQQQTAEQVLDKSIVIVRGLKSVWKAHVTKNLSFWGLVHSHSLLAYAGIIHNRRHKRDLWSADMFPSKSRSELGTNQFTTTLIQFTVRATECGTLNCAIMRRLGPEREQS